MQHVPLSVSLLRSSKFIGGNGDMPNRVYAINILPKFSIFLLSESVISCTLKSLVKLHQPGYYNSYGTAVCVLTIQSYAAVYQHL